MFATIKFIFKEDIGVKKQKYLFEITSTVSLLVYFFAIPKSVTDNNPWSLVTLGIYFLVIGVVPIGAHVLYKPQFNIFSLLIIIHILFIIAAVSFITTGLVIHLYQLFSASLKITSTDQSITLLNSAISIAVPITTLLGTASIATAGFLIRDRKLVKTKD